MSPNAKVVTYTTFFTIVILFLFLGYSSIANIKSAKLDPRTFYLSELIENGQEISILAEKLYKMIDNYSIKKNTTPVLIKDEEGNSEQISQSDILYYEIDKILSKTTKKRAFIDRFNKQEFSDAYKKSVDYYYKASGIIINICEEALSELEENEETLQALPRHMYYKKQLGNNGETIKHYIGRGQSCLKH